MYRYVVYISDPMDTDDSDGIMPNARGRNVVKFGPDR